MAELKLDLIAIAPDSLTIDLTLALPMNADHATIGIKDRTTTHASDRHGIIAYPCGRLVGRP